MILPANGLKSAYGLNLGLDLESTECPSKCSALDKWSNHKLKESLGEMTFSCQGKSKLNFSFINLFFSRFTTVTDCEKTQF